MNNILLQFIKTHEDAVLPKRNHDDSFEHARDGDSGYDLTCVEDTIIPAGERAVVPVGLKLGFISPGYWIRIESRSGHAFKRGIVAYCGVLDNGYRGDLSVLLFNMSADDFIIKKGERVAQLVIYPLISAQCGFCDEPMKSLRGEKGFGSSGQ